MTKPMRIAVFAYEFPALSETFVLNQITGLIDMGHDVTVFASRPRAETTVHEDVRAYHLARHTRYPGMPADPVRRARGGLPRLIRLGMANPRGLANCLDVYRHGRAAASGRLLYWGACVAREEPFDVILAHFGPMGELAATLREAGVIQGRLATVMHGVDVSAPWLHSRDEYQRLFRSGDLFLPISELWRRRLLELGCRPAKAVVHHMGVDTNRYRFRPRRQPVGVPLALLTVGRMVEKKGIAHAIRAVAALVTEGISIRYVIVGDGPLYEELIGLRDELGLQKHIRFVGPRNQRDIAAIMQQCDLLLAPSVTTTDGDQEGIPVTIMEAMASGMPVVSTWHSGIPELVEDGVSGLLVPEGDPVALAEAIWRLANAKDDAWAALSEAARARVLEAFDVKSLNRRLESLLAGLLPGPLPDLEWSPPRSAPPDRPVAAAARRTG